VRVFIARRGADPREHKRGPINDFVLNPPKIPSHHADDVKTVIEGLDIVTAAIAIPVTIAHAHFLHIELARPATRDEVLEALRRTPRILLFSSSRGFVSAAQVIEWARDAGRPRNDVPENIVFEDTLWVSGTELVAVMAVHQESIVVPENIDAIRALSGYSDKWSSIRATDESLGLVVEGKTYG
ncbi:MAG: type II glyceraldehyde-3-phosphate dehydrogenase, partial [Crenarchaeota archaeon]|nr:type II glyceraldehyde-3-phosphate dehydrogenase [Thermoproteota archaeon]